MGHRPQQPPLWLTHLPAFFSPNILKVLQDKNDPCKITILETYASQEAYKSHIASAHFQKYKQGTLHMVRSLSLDDQTPLNPKNKIENYIK